MNPKEEPLLMASEREDVTALSFRFASFLHEALDPAADPRKLELMIRLIDRGYEKPADPHDFERGLRILLGGQALRQTEEES